MRSFILLLALSSAASAETLVTPDLFRSLSAGKSMYFTRGGGFYGAEQFLPDQKTIWKFSDGTCVNGVWYVVGERICFVYEDDPTEHCWRMYDHGSDYTIRADGDVPTGDILLHSMDEQPLDCGPVPLS